jgi:outer membrane protein OmpA-like peptidoglycan-associated protein
LRGAGRDEAAAAQTRLARTQQELAELPAKQTDRGAVVTLGDVLFDSGQATPKPGAHLTLDRLAQYLRDHPDTRIMIEGHTDSRGSDAYNDALSERRAAAVESALEGRGVSADAMRAVGRDKAYPVATNDTSAGRQQNRRVEIVFSDNAGRFAQGDSSDSSEPLWPRHRRPHNAARTCCRWTAWRHPTDRPPIRHSSSGCRATATWIRPICRGCARP